MDITHEDLVRGAGLRVTKPRLAVFAAVEANPHADAAQILTIVRDHIPTVSHQAVYDCLASLADAGLLRRIEPAGSPTRYESRVGDNHHHMICRQCAVIIDIDCALGEAPCLTPDSPQGFVVDEAEVTYWGLCATCAAHPLSLTPN
ncbi:transcriptional repressor [Micrococcales bacterium 31B]|nr:transcriptional repressor [Micrococcales bacterium 31B]